MVRGDRYDESDRAYEERAAAAEGAWLGWVSVELFLILGIILFLIPEPISSTLGMILIALAVIAWAAEAIA